MAKKEGMKSGRWSPEEDDALRKQYANMTDEQLAKELNRPVDGVRNRRRLLGLEDKKAKSITLDPEKSREAYIASMSDDERKEFFRNELRKSTLYKSTKAVLDPEELVLYEDKYVDFMSDPTIETMTVMEKDALHDMTVAQIRIFRHLKEERNASAKGEPISRAKEIQACQDVVSRAQESLNVQRKQRLKNQNDQAVTFTNVIKELKDPNIRRKTGVEATMFKFIAEKFYNDHVGVNIISGKDTTYDTSKLFKDGVEPSGLTSKFTE